MKIWLNIKSEGWKKCHVQFDAYLGMISFCWSTVHVCVQLYYPTKLYALYLIKKKGNTVLSMPKCNNHTIGTKDIIDSKNSGRTTKERGTKKKTLSSFYLSVYPSVRPSFRLSVCLSVCLSVYLMFIYLFVCLSVCLSVYMCPSICLSVCLQSLFDDVIDSD